MQRLVKKVTAPIARSTAYDFNCHLSKCHTRPADQRRTGFHAAENDENVSVMPHELLFVVTDKSSSSTRRMHAMSSLNGYQFSAAATRDILQAIKTFHPEGDTYGNDIYKPPDNVKCSTMSARQKQGLNRVLNAYIRYVGVAITGCHGGASNALQRQGFAASRGGLMTILHTGPDIPAGAKVRLEVDCSCLFADGLHSKVHQTGIPRDKIVARLVEVADDEDMMSLDTTPKSYRLRGTGRMSFGKYENRYAAAAA